MTHPNTIWFDAGETYPLGSLPSHAYGKWPCNCEPCQRPMREGDGPRPPCAYGRTFDKREAQTDG